MIPTVGAHVSGQQARRDDQMLYLMIKPYAGQAAIMDGLRRTHDLSPKYAVDRIHMTLVPFGDIRTISPQNLDLIRRAAASLQAEPFEVTLNRIKGNALVGSRMQALHDVSTVTGEAARSVRNRSAGLCIQATRVAYL